MTTAQLQPPLAVDPATPEYLRNLRALWKHDPRLALALEALPDRLLPVPEPAKDGTWTIKLHSVYLHSKYRPLEEATRWAENLPVHDKYVLVVSGFALGYHLKALWQKIPEGALVLVAEPNLPLLAQAFRLNDFTEMIESGRLLIFSELDRGYLVDRLEPRSALLTMKTDPAPPPQKTGSLTDPAADQPTAAPSPPLPPPEDATSAVALHSHAPSVQIAGPFHRAFQKMFTEFVSYTRTGYLTLMLNNVATCRNIANNLGRYVTTPPIDTLHQAFQNIPAILVAAGPSLAKNMHLLQEVKRGEKKAVIIAVQTMLKPLLAAGIEPDFVTSLDYNTVSTRFFENLEEAGTIKKVHLVAEAKANWNVLDVFSKGGGSMSLIANDFADKLLRGSIEPRMGLKAGATVAHLSFYLAEFLGCNPIILIGQDLGFVDGLYYKPGTAIHETWSVELGRFNSLETKEWERIARSKAILRKIPDIHGHPMYTEEQFFVYLQQFERDFAASRCRIIDATEGGARKEHVELMSLRAALDQFCNPEALAAPASGKPLPPWKIWPCTPAEKIRQAITTLETRTREAQAMHNTCAATIPLLEQMIEHQKDETKMRQLFVEVDRLRSKVGQDQTTFEMATHLNTIGELRRFQHDLAVKTHKKDTLERQRRQLLRDIDYVKNLRVGCERLLDILQESTHRLNHQAQALDQNHPWPTEVAGSTN